MSQRKTPKTLADEVLPCAVDSARLTRDGQIEFEYFWTVQLPSDFWKMYSQSGMGPIMKLPEAVEIDQNMFRRFLRLEKGPEEKILKFVLRYGPLPERDSLPRNQPIALWRKYSRIGNAIFRAGVAVQNDSLGEKNDWRVICEFLGRKDFMHLVGVEPDVASGPQPRDDYRKAVDVARKGLLGAAINKWYGLSPLHSLVAVVNDEIVIAPRSNGLLGVIIQQISQAIVTSHLAICSGCAARYKPERKPREGQRRYCGACRRANIPHAQAVRDYRQRAMRAEGTAEV